MQTSRIRSFVLIGPTGSGKTPLGDALTTVKLNHHPISHFDFGAHLRAFATNRHTVPSLPQSYQKEVRSLLATNALLADTQFSIATTILQQFITTHCYPHMSYLLLNGLPRNITQAKALQKVVSLAGVIALHCPPALVRKRITQNSGGDRTNRSDDTDDEITKKLEIYESQTHPLINYYRTHNVPIVDIFLSETSTIHKSIEIIQTAFADTIQP